MCHSSDREELIYRNNIDNVKPRGSFRDAVADLKVADRLLVDAYRLIQPIVNNSVKGSAERDWSASIPVRKMHEIFVLFNAIDNFRNRNG